MAKAKTSALRFRKLADKSGPEPTPGNPWPLLGVTLMDAAPKAHEISTGYVTGALDEGWLTATDPDGGMAKLKGDPKLGMVFEVGTLLTFDLVEGPLVYQVTRSAGVEPDESQPQGDLGYRYAVHGGYAVKLKEAPSRG